MSAPDPTQHDPAGSPADGAAAMPAAPVPGSAADPLTDAMQIAKGAADAKVGLKLLGGLAVRVVCPDYPPRLRRDQDIDFACLSKERKAVAAHLEKAGCTPDRRFNNLNGDRQMYFNAPSGRPIDVMVDRLTMCHTLDFRPSFAVLPHTVAVVDLLLSKLQIVELNEKDARDIVQLLSCMPITSDGAGLAIDSRRFCSVLAGDWGWWRTVTGNLDKLPALLAEHPQLSQPGMPFDPAEQATALRKLADETPKSMKWRMRAGVGDKVRWYELPEEVAH
jgi:hypothetical protein